MTPDLEHFDWRSYAACAGAPEGPDAFHPNGGDEKAVARIRATYCAPCPVREQCLALGLHTGASGLYGGTSGTERRALRRARVIIPPHVTARENRDREIRDLHAAGHANRDIAKKIRVTERTVQRVLAKAVAA